jgi:ribosomal protein S18 acetylase RimI-like enzyme
MSMTNANLESLTFRAATADDVQAIVALVQSAYRGAASRAGWTTEADLLDGQRTDADEVTTLIDAPASRILLGERGGVLLASAHLQKHGATCQFGMFAVRPDRQGAGLGTAMLTEAERRARDEWGCRTLQMTVITLRTELIAWYERRGYHRTGIFKPFPYGDVHFGIPKRDDLRFEVLHKSLS